MIEFIRVPLDFSQSLLTLGQAPHDERPCSPALTEPLDDNLSLSEPSQPRAQLHICNTISQTSRLLLSGMAMHGISEL